MTKPITQHEGNKYLRRIYPATIINGHTDGELPILVDVYAVLRAFNVTCPGRQQAIKKLLCAGIRGKGNEMEDLIGAEAALARAIEFQKLEDGIIQPKKEKEEIS